MIGFLLLYLLYTVVFESDFKPVSSEVTDEVLSLTLDKPSELQRQKIQLLGRRANEPSRTADKSASQNENERPRKLTLDEEDGKHSNTDEDSHRRFNIKKLGKYNSASVKNSCM